LGQPFSNYLVIQGGRISCTCNCWILCPFSSCWISWLGNDNGNLRKLFASNHRLRGLCQTIKVKSIRSALVSKVAIALRSPLASKVAIALRKGNMKYFNLTTNGKNDWFCVLNDVEFIKNSIKCKKWIWNVLTTIIYIRI
jgi:hypothetical protein